MSVRESILIYILKGYVSPEITRVINFECVCNVTKKYHRVLVDGNVTIIPQVSIVFRPIRDGISGSNLSVNSLDILKVLSD
jgi:hypothetical protein